MPFPESHPIITFELPDVQDNPAFAPTATFVEPYELDKASQPIATTLIALLATGVVIEPINTEPVPVNDCPEFVPINTLLVPIVLSSIRANWASAV